MKNWMTDYKTCLVNVRMVNFSQKADLQQGKEQSEEVKLGSKLINNLKPNKY